MPVERGERRVQPPRAVVVEQHPHPDAPVGGEAHLVEQQRARQVAVPDVVLHVQAARGGARQQDPRGEGDAPVVEHPQAVKARVGGGEALDAAPEGGPRGRR
jgi:hypothetical protein